MKHGNPKTAKHSLFLAWDYADAMQAEADKRAVKLPDVFFNTKKDEEWYPEHEIGRNYSPDDYVMYKGEKTLAVSINEEWQPDWSQAPNGFNRFVVGSAGGHGFFTNIEPTFQEDYYYIGSDGVVFHNHGYTGDWKNSLRKRPN